MGNTPVTYVDLTGVHVPDFPSILSYFQSAYRAIYGDDVYLGNDSQDGQWIGVLASAINDANAMAAQAYNAYSPATAQGTGLSSVVKINGIARKVPSKSTADLLITGQAGTIITNGIAGDIHNFQWALPSTVIIPYSGQIVVTSICTTPGANGAEPGTINSISANQVGWQTVTNPLAAVPGAPIETDAQLRARQTVSTEIPALGLLEGLAGSLWAVTGVTQLAIFENTFNSPDINGIPGHCLAIVVDGGDISALTAVIKDKKGGGVGTYGNVVQTIFDEWSVPHQIAFFRPIRVPVTWIVSLNAYPGYTQNVERSIAQAISDWTNGLGIGKPVLYKRGYVPANLSGGPNSSTFDLLDLRVARDGQAPAGADVAIAFNEEAFCDVSYVQFLYPNAS